MHFKKKEKEERRKERKKEANVKNADQKNSTDSSIPRSPVMSGLGHWIKIAGSHNSRGPPTSQSMSLVSSE